MFELVDSLVDLIAALRQVAVALFLVVKPLLPIIAWFAFWYFAVDWVRLRSILGAGGWVVPSLIAIFAVAVRVVTAESSATAMPFGPGTLSPFVASVAWTSLFAALALIAGAAQVSRRTNG